MKTDQQQERERITMLRELLQMSQTEFAKQIGISQGALSQIESGRSRLSMETIKNLSCAYNVNCNWLINGKGEIFYANKNDKEKNRKGILIPLVDKKALAGYYRGYSNTEFLKTLATYQLPGFDNGDYRLFEIQGESMVPTLYPTEIVIAKRVENFNDIEDNTVNVILLTKALLAKRIFWSTEDKSHILAKCDNPGFEGKKIKVNDIREIWAVEGKITRKFLSDATYDPDRIKNMEKGLQELQFKVDKLMR